MSARRSPRQDPATLRVVVLAALLAMAVWALFSVVRGPSYDIGAPPAPLRALGDPTPILASAAELAADWEVLLGPAWPDGATVDRDPPGQDVFVVAEEEGEPVLRVSGARWGALTSRFAVGDFAWTGEYRWGDAVSPWPGFRDSGLMFRSFGIPFAVSRGGGELAPARGRGHFMSSVEYQIAGRDVGTAMPLGPARFRTTLTRTSDGVEHPIGAWNTFEIDAVGSAARLLLNGVVTGAVADLRRADTGAPLPSGRLQIQSEGAEITFRRMTLRRLDALP